MLSSGTACYHLGWNIIIWDAMLSSGANVIIWDKMLSSGANVIMVSSGLSCDVFIWDDNTPLFCFSWKLHSLLYSWIFFYALYFLCASDSFFCFKKCHVFFVSFNIATFRINVGVRTEIFRDPHDPLLFCVAQGIFWLSTERLSRSTLHLKEGERGVWGVFTLVLCSLATVTSCIDASVRIVTKPEGETST